MATFKTDQDYQGAREALSTREMKEIELKRVGRHLFSPPELDGTTVLHVWTPLEVKKRNCFWIFCSNSDLRWSDDQTDFRTPGGVGLSAKDSRDQPHLM